MWHGLPAIPLISFIFFHKVFLQTVHISERWNWSQIKWTVVCRCLLIFPSFSQSQPFRFLAVERLSLYSCNCSPTPALLPPPLNVVEVVLSVVWEHSWASFESKWLCSIGLQLGHSAVISSFHRCYRIHSIQLVASIFGLVLNSIRIPRSDHLQLSVTLLQDSNGRSTMKVDTEHMKDCCLHWEKPMGTRCSEHGRRWAILHIANEEGLDIAFSLE